MGRLNEAGGERGRLGGERGRSGGGEMARTETATETCLLLGATGGRTVVVGGGGDAIRAGRGETTRSGRGGGEATRIAFGGGEATRIAFGGGDATRSIGLVDFAELGTISIRVVGRTGGQVGGGSLGGLGPTNMDATLSSESPVSRIT